jgi:hypothetical protein
MKPNEKDPRGRLRKKWKQQFRKILHRSKEGLGRTKRIFEKRKTDREGGLLNEPHGNEKTDSNIVISGSLNGLLQLQIIQHIKQHHK